MAVPSTYGYLRTKLEDMKIGDYLACKYSPNGLFSSLGVKNLPFAELSVNGSTKISGLFYFVKVASGLLVADRVIHTDISTSAINNWGHIEGKETEFGSLVPHMTGNVDIFGEATASSSYTINYQPWKVFDGTLNEWLSSVGYTQWLQYKFNDPKMVNRLELTSSGSSTLIPRMPSSFTFEASNAGVFTGEQEVLLTVQNDVPYTASESRTFKFNNRKKYKYYRIAMTNNYSPTPSTYYEYAIGKVDFYEKSVIGKIRSLTGGLDYADAEGNISTVDLNLGAYPSDNEWDKYIANFPQDRIIIGKELDDVFHWKGVYTYTQSTPSTVRTIASENNVVRGHITPKTFSYISYNSTYSSYGFRPVFEYDEF